MSDHYGRHWEKCPTCGELGITEDSKHCCHCKAEFCTHCEDFTVIVDKDKFERCQICKTEYDDGHEIIPEILHEKDYDWRD